MKLGIKVAPGNAYKTDIESTHPAMVEVWYNATKPTDYTEMFSYLKTQKIDVGLHFWGVLKDNILPNLSYPDPTIHKPSRELVKHTIDIAAANGFAYVNIHPDLLALLKVDFSTMAIQTITKPMDVGQTQAQFVDQITQMHEYAQSRGIILTVETVPQRDTPSWNLPRDRSKVIDIYQMPIDVQIDLAARGLFIANDFCHTACSIRSDDRTTISDFLMNTTQTLAAQTKLIHLGYVAQPFNGVDFHDSLDNPIVETKDAIPNKKEMIELLKLFKNRDDVWILVEPERDHKKNYFLAKKLLDQARKI